MAIGDFLILYRDFTDSKALVRIPVKVTTIIIKLDPFAYLHYVLKRAPRLSSEEDWDSVLPLYLDTEKIDNAFPKPAKVL